MLTGGNSAMAMSDLCRMATPLSLLSVGTEMWYVAVAVFIVLLLGFLDSFNVIMSGWYSSRYAVISVSLLLMLLML